MEAYKSNFIHHQTRGICFPLIGLFPFQVVSTAVRHKGIGAKGVSIKRLRIHGYECFT